jgi:hypothetical protein
MRWLGILLACLLAAETHSAGVGGSHLSDAQHVEFARSQGVSVNDAAVNATFSPTAAPTAGKRSQCSVLYICSTLWMLLALLDVLPFVTPWMHIRSQFATDLTLMLYWSP